MVVLAPRECLASGPPYLAVQHPSWSGARSPQGILRTKRSWPADGAAVIQTGTSASQSSPGRWNPQILLPGAVWKESSGCGLHYMDLWTPISLWGAQLCLGERGRYRVSWGRYR